jgi:hypothetical protein
LISRLGALFGLRTAVLSVPLRLVFLFSLLLAAANAVVTWNDVREYGGTDLRARVVGARLLVLGENPYRPQAGPVRESLFDPHGGYRDVSRCTYGPPLLAVYAALCWLPYGIQRLAWFVLEWLALLASIALLARTIRGSRTRAWFVVAALVFFAGGAFWRLHVERGQYYSLLLVLLSWFAWQVKRGYRDDWRSGLPLGLAAALRPTLGVAVLPLWLLGHRRTAAGAAGSALAVGLILLPLAGPGLWRDYTRLVDAFERAAPGLPPRVSPPYRGLVEGAEFGRVLEHRSSNANLHRLLLTTRERTGWPDLAALPVLAKASWLATMTAILGILAAARGARWGPSAVLLASFGVMMATEHFLPLRWGYNDVLYLAPLAMLAPVLARRTSRVWLIVVSSALVLGHDRMGLLDGPTGTLVRAALLSTAIVGWLMAAAHRRRKAARRITTA